MTIAQQLKIKEFPFTINDKNGNRIYWETSSGYWSKREYDAGGNVIHYETSDGFWSKREHDANGIRIYYENSDGEIIDNRPKTDVQQAIELLTKEGLKMLKN